MFKKMTKPFSSIEKHLEKTLELYNIELLNAELGKVQSHLSINNKFDYDKEICIAEIDIIKAAEYNDRFNYINVLTTVAAAFLLAINVTDIFLIKICFALLFFAVGFTSLIYRANLAGKMSNAKQRVLCLKLAKELNKSE